MPGPAIRTDIVDVYVFRRPAGGLPGQVEFLQLRRARDPMAGSWQPVMGHVEQGETATRAALRELVEETGFGPGSAGLAGFWQLESVNAFFLASMDAVMLSPCFAAQVESGAEPRIDAAHDAARWVARDQADRAFLWPGQRQAVEQIVRDLIVPDTEIETRLRVKPV